MEGINPSISLSPSINPSINPNKVLMKRASLR